MAANQRKFICTWTLMMVGVVVLIRQYPRLKCLVALYTLQRSDSRFSSFREHHISIHISRNRGATSGPAGEGFGGEHDNYTWRNGH